MKQVVLAELAVNSGSETILLLKVFKDDCFRSISFFMNVYLVSYTQFFPNSNQAWSRRNRKKSRSCILSMFMFTVNIGVLELLVVS